MDTKANRSARWARRRARGNARYCQRGYVAGNVRYSGKGGGGGRPDTRASRRRSGGLEIAEHATPGAEPFNAWDVCLGSGWLYACDCTACKWSDHDHYLHQQRASVAWAEYRFAHYRAEMPREPDPAWEVDAERWAA